MNVAQVPFRLFLVTTAVVGASCAAAPGVVSPLAAAPAMPAEEVIAPYQARFGRLRPVIAVVGDTGGTEVTDFVIPFGVLAQSGAAEVLSVATQPGPMTMLPALTIEPDATSAAFDARFPEGADYVIVPAVGRSDEPKLTSWVAAQADKGATVVGVCEGVQVLGNAGLLQGRRATGHWLSEGDRRQKYPRTQWVTNRRYVADGKLVTTSGVTAAMPAALALVEAITGKQRTVALARELGVEDWSSTHDSEPYRITPGFVFTGIGNMLSFWSYQDVGIPVAPGVDEIALALTADAYSRTGRSRLFSVAASRDSLRTRNGLALVPDKVSGTANPSYRTLPALDTTGGSWLALERALDGIGAAYGPATVNHIALQLEYPTRTR